MVKVMKKKHLKEQLDVLSTLYDELRTEHDALSTENEELKSRVNKFISENVALSTKNKVLSTKNKELLFKCNVRTHNILHAENERLYNLLYNKPNPANVIHDAQNNCG